MDPGVYDCSGSKSSGKAEKPANGIDWLCEGRGCKTSPKYGGAQTGNRTHAPTITFKWATFVLLALLEPRPVAPSPPLRGWWWGWWCAVGWCGGGGGAGIIILAPWEESWGWTSTIPTLMLSNGPPRTEEPSFPPCSPVSDVPPPPRWLVDVVVSGSIFRLALQERSQCSPLEEGGDTTIAGKSQ